MLKPEIALRKVVEATPGPFYELKAVEKCAGHFLGEDITSQTDLPPFDNSSVDGYALRSRDTHYASSSRPVKLKITGEVFAGDKPSLVISSGECCWIATGAKMPAGADAVIMFEEVKEKNGYIEVRRPVKKGEHVRKRGFELKRGKLLLKKGTFLTPPAIGLISGAGHSQVVVGIIPSVHVIITGEEIVKPGRREEEGKIYDANGPALKAFFRLHQIEPRIYYAGDTPQSLLKILRKIDTRTPSVVLISGGASVGKRDFARAVLKEAGVKEIFWKVAQKPGKPLLFGVKNSTAFFALPGNPASALICTYLYVTSSLKKMMGASNPYPLKLKAVLENEVERLKDRTQFLRGQILYSGSSIKAKTFRKQNSSVLTTFAAADVLVEIPAGKGILTKGKTVNVYPLTSIF